MLAYLMVLCLLGQPQLPAAGQGATRLAAEDLSTLTLPDLLKRIPEAGAENRWAPEQHAWVQDAAAIELHRRIIHGDLTEDQWPLVLEAAKVIAVPRKWPKSRPLAISVIPPLWLGSPGWIEVTPRISNAKKTRESMLQGECALAADSDRERRRFMEVGGPLPAGTHEVTLDVKLEARRLDDDHLTSGHERRWHGTISLPVQVVDTDADASEPVKDAAFDQAVKGAVSVSVGLNQESP